MTRKKIFYSLIGFNLFFYIECVNLSKGSCKSYNQLEIPQIISLPSLNLKSGIGQIFTALNSHSFEFPNHSSISSDNNPLRCYKWKCKSFNKKNCSYCLPSVFVAGFSKCGTTALCSKLILHPDIKPYRKKEINIFTKYFDEFKWKQFEKRVFDTNPEVIFLLYSYFFLYFYFLSLFLSFSLSLSRKLESSI